MDETDLELHLPGMNFCGPGTNFETRLEIDGKTPKACSRPVDRIDEAALRHDLFYAQHDGARERCVADKQMLDEIASISDPTCRESFERIIVTFCLTIKRFFTLLILRLIDAARRA